MAFERFEAISSRCNLSPSPSMSSPKHSRDAELRGMYNISRPRHILLILWHFPSYALLRFFAFCLRWLKLVRKDKLFGNNFNSLEVFIGHWLKCSIVQHCATAFFPRPAHSFLGICGIYIVNLKKFHIFLRCCEQAQELYHNVQDLWRVLIHAVVLL